MIYFDIDNKKHTKEETMYIDIPQLHDKDKGIGKEADISILSYGRETFNNNGSTEMNRIIPDELIELLRMPAEDIQQNSKDYQIANSMEENNYSNTITFVWEQYFQTEMERVSCESGYEVKQHEIKLYHAGEYIGQTSVVEYMGTDVNFIVDNMIFERPEPSQGVDTGTKRSIHAKKNTKEKSHITNKISEAIAYSYSEMNRDVPYAFSEEALNHLSHADEGEIHFLYVENTYIKEQHLDKKYQEALLNMIEAFIKDCNQDILINLETDYYYLENVTGEPSIREHKGKIRENYLRHYNTKSANINIAIMSPSDKIIIVKENPKQLVDAG